MGGGEAEAGAAADGSERDRSGEEAEVCEGGEQLGEPGAVLVWRRAKEKETMDQFFRTQRRRNQLGRIEAACLDM